MFTSVWVLLTLTICGVSTQSWAPWYSSTCNSKCYCIVKGGLKCFIQSNGSELSGSHIECSEMDAGILHLSVTCRQDYSCAEVHVRQILDHFSDLKLLQLDNCSLDFSGYEVLRHHSSHSFTVNLARETGRYSKFAFHFHVKPVLAYQDANITLPACKLEKLFLRFARLPLMPIGFINTCKQVSFLSLENNDLTFLDTIDIAVLATKPNLFLLNLRRNYLHEIGATFVSEAMKHVLCFLTGHLTSWINKTSYLTPNESFGFHQLARDFQGWSSNSSPLHFNDLLSFLESAGLEIDFTINSAPLSRLLLGYNQLTNLQPIFIGFNKLLILDIQRNNFKLPYMREHLRFVFYCIGNFLRVVNWSNNAIEELLDHTFQYLYEITEVNLASNRLMNIESKAFAKKNMIKHLNISNNLLERVEFFYVMEKLVVLDAAKNRILFLSKDLSEKIPNIEIINMNSNPLTTIAPFSLSKLNNLLLFKLENTGMTDFPHSYFKTSSRAARKSRIVVNIFNNTKPINCDCYSVFPRLKEGMDQFYNLSYPLLLWTLHKTMCAQSYLTVGYELTLKNRKFPCVFRDRKLIKFDKGQSIHMQCPDKCICSFTTEMKIKMNINCSKQSLDDVPRIRLTSTDVNFNIFIIDAVLLNNNNIKFIRTNDFTQKLRSLTSLNLAYNQLEILGPRIFHHLTSLQFLDISYNPITSIDCATFATSTTLSTLYMRNVFLTSLNKEPFTALTNLSFLILTLKKRFSCDCGSLLEFYDFQSRGEARIDLQGECTWQIDGRAMTIPEAEALCLLSRRKKEARRLKTLSCVLRVIRDCSLLLVICCIFFFVSRHRYRIVGFLDGAVRSTVGRNFLHLSRYNLTHEIDVAFLVHERQTEQYRDMLSQLKKSSRRDLVVIRFADRIPGATHLSSIGELAQNVAVGVVLLSKDLLEDAATYKPLQLLLSRFLERRQKGRRIVPVLLDRALLTHQLWLSISILMDRWPLLAWQQPSFWPRFLAALPAPNVGGNVVDEDDAHMRLVTSMSPAHTQILPLADVCIIAEESQTERGVRRLYDRYRGSRTLCYLCRDSLYGVAASAVRGQSLKEVLAQCPQLLVLVSSELLASSWCEQHLFPALEAHINAMPFRGAVILVELSLSVANLCRTQRFRFYNQLRKQNLTVTMTWQALEANWNLLNALFISASGNPYLTAMDEIEFSTLLSLPTVRVTDGNPEKRAFMSEACDGYCDGNSIDSFS